MLILSWELRGFMDVYPQSMVPDENILQKAKVKAGTDTR
tara:strand:- start:821 stop:937 length:117 start_codon:yes stop_codon:yes gene_type:complete